MKFTNTTRYPVKLPNANSRLFGKDVTANEPGNQYTFQSILDYVQDNIVFQSGSSAIQALSDDQIRVAEIADSTAVFNADTKRFEYQYNNDRIDPVVYSAQHSDILEIINMSRTGYALIQSLSDTRSAGSATFFFATFKTGIITVYASSSTGYLRLINPDGSLGAQFGAGLPWAITVNIPVSSGLRAYGIMSVNDGGEVQSGAITGVSIYGQRVVAFYGPLTAAEYIQLPGNYMTEFRGESLWAALNLDLSGNPLLKFDVELTGASQLNYLDITGHRVRSLRLVNQANLASAYVGYSQEMESLTVENCPVIDTMDVSNSKLKTIAVANSVINELNVRENLIETIPTLSSTNAIYASGCRIESFDGSGFSALTILDISDNPLVSIDVSAVNSLEDLDASDTLLTELDVSQNDNLIELEVNRSSLNSVLLSPALEYVSLRTNNIASIDLSLCVDMRYVELDRNILTSISIPANWTGNDVGYLSVEHNLLSGQILDNLYNTLGTANGSKNAIVVYENPGVNDDDPSIATAKGWNVFGSEIED